MSVGRTALRIAPLALLARGAAFGIPVLVASTFGVGPITDAWFWALAFPTFTLVLASSALGTASLPVLARVRAEAPERLPSLVGGLLGWAALGGLAFGLGLALLLPPALPHLTRFDEATAALARQFLWALLPFMVMTCIGAVLRVTCEIHERFAEVALTPLVRAGTVMAGIWLLRPYLGPFALPAAMVAGEVVQDLYWVGLLARAGVPVRPSLHLDAAVRAVAADLAPILGGEVLVALNFVVDKAFAASLPTGSVATMEYADRARVIPQTLLESSLLMVSFATWSNLRAQGRAEEARSSVGHTLRWVLALASPVLAGMYIGRSVLVQVLFERGVFTPENTAATAAVLAWFIPGILPNLLATLAVRAHVVERNLRLILGLGALSLLVNTTANALLVGPMGLEGLALATTLNAALIAGLYLLTLGRSAQGERRTAVAAAVVAAMAVAVAAAVELGPGAPVRVTDPVLWIAAVLCVALLAVGARATSSPPPSSAD